MTPPTKESKSTSKKSSKTTFMAANPDIMSLVMCKKWLPMSKTSTTSLKILNMMSDLNYQLSLPWKKTSISKKMKATSRKAAMKGNLMR